MNLRITAQLNTVGACLTVAYSSDYLSVWTAKEPADFTTDLAKLQTDYTAVAAKAVLAKGAAGGGGDAKAVAESAVEDGTFVLARALANHFKKTGDVDSRAKVDVSHSDVVLLRDRELAAKASTIRALAAAAQSEPEATGRGVTAARVAALGAAIAAFESVMSIPRGQIVNRATLLKEVETDTAGLMVQLHDLDDLVLQFDGTPAGKRFVEAWKRARIVIDLGGHLPADDTPPGGTPVPPAA